MGNYNIGLLKGDGIGPEIVNASVKVLDALGSKYGHSFNYTTGLIGGESIDIHNNPLTDEVVAMCKKQDAVILGAVGGPKWDNVAREIRPESGLLKIRKELNVFANLRLSKAYDSLVDSSPLKKELIDGFDCLIVRELTGGIYFGEQYFDENDDKAFSKMEYTSEEIRRIAVIAFEAAMTRNKKVTSVDKANVLAVSMLWRKIVIEVSKDYPEVALDHLYVDFAAMKLVTDPSYFDVIVTSNLFGDIISDEAAVMTGSIGLLPSASLGDETSIALYEPIHGSAPDIAGKNIANPIATVLSVAMMLRYSFKLEKEAKALEDAVESLLNDGYGTVEIVKDKNKVLNTAEVADKLIEKL